MNSIPAPDINDKYNFIFTDNSGVFHDRSCRALRSARSVRGTRYYQTCLYSGRHPCKLCRPIPESSDIVTDGTLEDREAQDSQIEQRAVKQHRRAVAERFALESKTYLPLEKKVDMFTLSRPGYAFFASKGYSNFHLRNCRRLSGLSNLTGFPLYEDAIKAGYTPCKSCKPSVKQNIRVSIPIYSRKRSSETMNQLMEYCSIHDFHAIVQGDFLYIETSEGIWRLNITKTTFRLEHINLNKTGEDQGKFHMQPRLFLSMIDALYYIKRHDDKLSFVWDEDQYVPLEFIVEEDTNMDLE